MRKSTVFLISGLWLLAIINMWLVMRAGEQHAREAQQRLRVIAPKNAPKPGDAIEITIAESVPDTPGASPDPASR